MQKSTLISLLNKILNNYGDQPNRVESTEAMPFSLQELEIVPNNTFSNETPELFPTISSFANQDGGGVLVFGMRQSKEKHNRPFLYAEGVNEPDRLVQDILTQCAQMQPIVEPLFTDCVLDGRLYIAVEIPGAQDELRPVYYRGSGIKYGAFVRVGNRNEPIEDFDIYSYTARQGAHEDMRIIEHSDVAQLDAGLVKRYTESAVSMYPHLSEQDVLTVMGLQREGCLSVAAVMSLTLLPQAILPGHCVEFSDGFKAEGTIERMVDDATAHILATKGLIGLPESAIRQAILNALMHRDYSVYSESMPVRVTLEGRSVKIENPIGAENAGLTTVLTHLGVTQAIHGVSAIKEAMESNGLGAPEVNIARHVYTVVLKNAEESSETKPPRGRRKVTKAVAKDVPKTPKKRGRPSLKEKAAREQAARDKTPKNSQSSMERLVEFCAEPRSRAEIVEFLGTGYAHAMYNIVKPLIEQGKLSMTIPDEPRSREQRFIAR